MIKRIIFLTLASCWLFFPCVSQAETTHHVASADVSHVQNQTKQRTSHQQAIGHHKKTKKSKRRRQVHKSAPVPNDRTALVAPVPVQAKSPGLFASIGQRLVEFVHSTVSTLRYSTYKLGGTHFDASHGIYIVDCSDYIDNVLHAVYPDAYFDLVNTSGADKPTTQHYYDFFSTLPDDPKDYWSTVRDVEKLQPGDILVFRYHANRGGHVMVVMDKPIRDDGDAFLVRVADSAPVGHSEDTRPGHVSGIGIGTLLLKTRPKTGEPLAFAWKVGARWERNVNIAMARPQRIS